MSEKATTIDGWTRLGIHPTPIGTVPAILDIVSAMERRMAVCLVGETGIGETPIVEQYTAARDGYRGVFNMGHASQQDLSLPMFSESGDTYSFVKADWLERVNDMAEEKGFAVMFLDEWNRGSKAMVNALFTLCDDRRMHSHRLHPNVQIVAAMNPSDGVYLVNEAEKDHAIRKRLNFVYCTQDLASLLKYAEATQWFPQVIQFLRSAQEFVYDAGARDAGKQFPCPSNWEKVSYILKSAESQGAALNGAATRALVAGQVGMTAASKILDFIEDENTLIQPAEVIHKYAARSNVRQRVAKLLNATIAADGTLVRDAATAYKTSALTELTNNVAFELFNMKPDPEITSEYLTRFISDLPNEHLSVFAATQLREQRDVHGPSGAKYMTELSAAWSQYPNYLEKMRNITQGERNYKESKGL